MNISLDQRFIFYLKETISKTKKGIIPALYRYNSIQINKKLRHPAHGLLKQKLRVIGLFLIIVLSGSLQAGIVKGLRQGAAKSGADGAPKFHCRLF